MDLLLLSYFRNYFPLPKSKNRFRGNRGFSFIFEFLFSIFNFGGFISKRKTKQQVFDGGRGREPAAE